MDAIKVYEQFKNEFEIPYKTYFKSKKKLRITSWKIFNLVIFTHYGDIICLKIILSREKIFFNKFPSNKFIESQNSFFSHLLVHRLLIEQTLLRFLIRAQIDRAREFIDSCCECRPNNPPRKFLWGALNGKEEWFAFHYTNRLSLSRRLNESSDD